MKNKLKIIEMFFYDGCNDPSNTNIEYNRETNDLIIKQWGHMYKKEEMEAAKLLADIEHSMAAADDYDKYSSCPKCGYIYTNIANAEYCTVCGSHKPLREKDFIYENTIITIHNFFDINSTIYKIINSKKCDVRFWYKNIILSISALHKASSIEEFKSILHNPLIGKFYVDYKPYVHYDSRYMCVVENSYNGCNWALQANLLDLTINCSKCKAEHDIKLYDYYKKESLINLEYCYHCGGKVDVKDIIFYMNIEYIFNFDDVINNALPQL